MLYFNIILLGFILFLVKINAKNTDEKVFYCSYPDSRLGFTMVLSNKPLESGKAEEYLDHIPTRGNTVICDNTKSISLVDSSKTVCFFPILLKDNSFSTGLVAKKPVCFSNKNGKAGYPFEKFDFKIDIPYHACGQFARRGCGKDINIVCPFNKEPDKSEICKSFSHNHYFIDKRFVAEFCTKDGFCYSAIENWGEYEESDRIDEGQERLRFFTLDIEGIETYTIYDNKNFRLVSGRWVCRDGEHKVNGKGYGFGHCHHDGHEDDNNNYEESDDSVCNEDDDNKYCDDVDKANEKSLCYECRSGDENNKDIKKCFRCLTDIPSNPCYVNSGCTEEDKKNYNNDCYECTEDDKADINKPKCFECDSTNPNHPCYLPPENIKVTFHFGYFGQTEFEILYYINNQSFVYNNLLRKTTERYLGDVIINVPYTTSKVAIRYKTQYTPTYHISYYIITDEEKINGKSISMEELPITEKYIQIPQEIEFTEEWFDSQIRLLNSLNISTDGSKYFDENYMVFNSRQFAIAQPVLYASIWSDAGNCGNYFQNTPLAIVRHNGIANGQINKTSAAFYFGFFNVDRSFDLRFIMPTDNTNCGLDIRMDCGAKGKPSCTSVIDEAVKKWFISVTYNVPNKYKYVHAGAHLLRIARNSSYDNTDFSHNGSLLLFYNPNKENEKEQKHYFMGKDISLLQVDSSISILMNNKFNFYTFVMPYINDEDGKYTSYGNFLGTIVLEPIIHNSSELQKTNNYDITSKVLRVYKFVFENAKPENILNFPYTIDFSTDVSAIGKNIDNGMKRYYNYAAFSGNTYHQIKAKNTLYYIFPYFEGYNAEWCLINGAFSDDTFYVGEYDYRKLVAEGRMSCTILSQSIPDFEENYNEAEDDQNEPESECIVDLINYVADQKAYSVPTATIKFNGYYKVNKNTIIANEAETQEAAYNYFTDSNGSVDLSDEDKTFFHKNFFAKYIVNKGCDIYAYKTAKMTFKYMNGDMLEINESVKAEINENENGCEQIDFKVDYNDLLVCYIDLSIENEDYTLEDAFTYTPIVSSKNSFTYDNISYMEMLGSPKNGPSITVSYDYILYSIPDGYKFATVFTKESQHLAFIGKLRTFGYNSLLFIGKNGKVISTMDSHTSDIQVSLESTLKLELFKNNKYYVTEIPAAVLLMKENVNELDDFDVNRYDITKIVPIHVPVSLKDKLSDENRFDFISYAPVQPDSVADNENNHYSPFILPALSEYDNVAFICELPSQITDDNVIVETLFKNNKTAKILYQLPHNLDSRYVVPIKSYDGYIVLKCTYKYNVDEEPLKYTIKRIVSNNFYYNWSNNIINDPTISNQIYKNGVIDNEFAYDISMNQASNVDSVYLNSLQNVELITFENAVGTKKFNVSVYIDLAKREPSTKNSTLYITDVRVVETGIIPNPILSSMDQFTKNTYVLNKTKTGIYFASEYPLRVVVSAITDINNNAVYDSITVVYSNEMIVKSEFETNETAFSKHYTTSLDQEFKYSEIDPAKIDEVKTVINACNNFYLPLVETMACISNTLLYSEKVNKDILLNSLNSFNQYNSLRNEIGLVSVWEAYNGNKKKFIESQNYLYAAIEIDEPLSDIYLSFGQVGKYYIPHGWEVASNDEATYSALSSFGALRNTVDRCFVLSDGYMYDRNGTKCGTTSEQVLRVQLDDGTIEKIYIKSSPDQDIFDYRIVSVDIEENIAGHILIRAPKTYTDDLLFNVYADWVLNPVSKKQIPIEDYIVSTENDIEDIISSLVEDVKLEETVARNLQAVLQYPQNDDLNVLEYGRYVKVHPYTDKDYYVSNTYNVERLIDTINPKDKSLIMYSCAYLPVNAEEMFNTNEMYKPDFQDYPQADDNSWKKILSVYVDADYGSLSIYGLARPFDATITEKWQCRDVRIPLYHYYSSDIIRSISVNFYYRNNNISNATDARFIVVGFRLESDEIILSQNNLFDVHSKDNKYYADMYTVNTNKLLVEHAGKNRFILPASTSNNDVRSLQYSLNFQNFIGVEGDPKMPGLRNNGMMIIVSGTINNPLEFYKISRDTLTQGFLDNLERSLDVFADFVDINGVWSNHWFNKMILTCDDENCTTISANGTLRVPGESETGDAIRSLKSYILVDNSDGDVFPNGLGKLDFTVKNFVVKVLPLTNTEIISKPSFSTKDPHFMSVRGVAFDFHQVGVYTYLKTSNNYSNINSEIAIKAVKEEDEEKNIRSIVSDFAISSDKGFAKITYDGKIIINGEEKLTNYVTNLKSKSYIKVEFFKDISTVSDYVTKRLTFVFETIKFVVDYMTVVTNVDSHYLNIISYIAKREAVTGGLIDDINYNIDEAIKNNLWKVQNTIFSKSEVEHIYTPVYTSDVMLKSEAEKICTKIYNKETDGYKNCLMDAVGFGIIPSDDPQLVEIYKNKKISFVDEVFVDDIIPPNNNVLIISCSVLAAVIVVLVIGLSVGLTKKNKMQKIKNKNVVMPNIDSVKEDKIEANQIEFITSIYSV